MKNEVSVLIFGRKGA